ncbi:MAG: FAD-dependent oxidoreductase, partial [Novosphingobium sp.]
VPVIAVNKIPTVDLAEQALVDGDCDLVGMTRAQIADPDLVYKLENGQAPRIRTCSGANQGCIDRVGAYPITCIQNPEVGEEDRFIALDAEPATPKRVLVVGGGPGGMKAAEIAARRGHQVTLVEKGHRLGGRLNLVEKLGAAANLLSMTAWLENELQLLQVPVLLQTEVDDAFLRDHAPDAIILATGARTHAEMPVASDDSVPMLDLDSAVLGQFEGQPFDMKGTHAVLLDQRANYETALAIEALVQRGAKVTVITPYLHFGANLGFTFLDDYLRLLPQWGVRVLAQSQCTGIADGAVTVASGATGGAETLACDFVVAGIPPRPADELSETCARHALTRIVGDAYAPRSALEAIREGDRIARTL